MITSEHAALIALRDDLSIYSTGPLLDERHFRLWRAIEWMGTGAPGMHWPSSSVKFNFQRFVYAVCDDFDTLDDVWDGLVMLSKIGLETCCRDELVEVGRLVASVMLDKMTGQCTIRMGSQPIEFTGVSAVAVLESRRRVGVNDKSAAVS